MKSSSHEMGRNPHAEKQRTLGTFSLRIVAYNVRVVCVSSARIDMPNSVDESPLPRARLHRLSDTTAEAASSSTSNLHIPTFTHLFGSDPT